MDFSLFFFLTVFWPEVLALDQTASLNVVLFFTNYNEDHVENIDYLNISTIAVVKACPESDQLTDETNESQCNCLQSFNDSVHSMVEWTRTSLHMTVAVVALKNFIKNNATTYHGDNEENSKNVNDYYFVELPVLFKIDSHLEVQKNGNGDETDPRKTMLNHFLNDQLQSKANLRRRPRTTHVPPVNYELEYIDSTTNNPTTTSLQLSKLIKDFFNSVGRITNILSSNATGFSDQLQKRSFFDASQDNAGNVVRVQKKEGFFLVFYGGELAMLKHPHSELVQSVKHVMKTTNNTLIVITSSCPKFSTNNTRIPVYATGPFAQKLANSTTLLDVTENLEEILSVRNIKPRNSEFIRNENSVHDDASKYSNTANLILTVFLYLLLN